MTLAEFQAWLNARGANLVVDGKRGPATRNAILTAFSNRNAAKASDSDIARAAIAIGCSVKQVRAVSKVESAGGGFNDQGQPKALFERHYAWRRLRVLIPFLSNPTPGGYTLDADRDGINDSWEKVADLAMMKNPLVAFESASFGKFQIMGAYAKSLGYGNAVEFVWQLVQSEAAHYDALAAFIRVNALDHAMRALSANPETCRAFAKGYNGKGYAKHGYHRKLAEAMR